MSSPELRVDRRVVVEMVRLASEEVPGVLRVGRRGPRWRAWLAGNPVRVRLAEGRADVRLAIVARPGHGLEPLVTQVRSAVAGAVERLLGLEATEVTIVVDAVG
ncbi:MAG TPA: Asp23/Gls24 family envelope stress response protein [Candidatus Limnocylindrales bacterium]